jgi:hypothetical protein
MNYEIYETEKIAEDIEIACIEHVNRNMPAIRMNWHTPGQCVFEVYSVPDCLKEWAESDSNPWKDEDHSVSIQKIYGGDRLYPHIDNFMINGKDVIKEYGINYLLQTSDAITEWYKSEDINSKIESYKFPIRTWHKIATGVYHGASRIGKESRIAIVLSPKISGLPKYL